MRHSFLVLSSCLAISASALSAHAAPVNPNSGQTIAGGATSSWLGIRNNCRSAGTGLCVEDAGFPFGGDDAFDSGLVLKYNATFYTPTTADLTGAVYTGGVTSIDGLDFQLTYTASQTDSVMRTVIAVTNPGTTGTAGTLRWQSNVGSDSNTTVRGTASGDTLFTEADQWIATDDNGLNDPRLLHILFGNGTVAEAPTSVSLTTDFSGAGTQGVLADFTIELGAGETEHFIFFNVLRPRNADAGSVLQFAADMVAAGRTSDLFAGLSDSVLDTTVNWTFAPTVQTPEPASLALLGAGVLGLAALRRRRG